MSGTAAAAAGRQDFAFARFEPAGAPPRPTVSFAGSGRVSPLVDGSGQAPPLFNRKRTASRPASKAAVAAQGLEIERLRAQIESMPSGPLAASPSPFVYDVADSPQRSGPAQAAVTASSALPPPSLTSLRTAIAVVTSMNRGLRLDLQSSFPILSELWSSTLYSPAKVLWDVCVGLGVLYPVDSVLLSVSRPPARVQWASLMGALPDLILTLSDAASSPAASTPSPSPRPDSGDNSGRVTHLGPTREAAIAEGSFYKPFPVSHKRWATFCGSSRGRIAFLNDATVSASNYLVLEVTGCADGRFFSDSKAVSAWLGEVELSRYAQPAQITAAMRTCTNVSLFDFASAGACYGPVSLAKLTNCVANVLALWDLFYGHDNPLSAAMSKLSGAFEDGIQSCCETVAETMLAAGYSHAEVNAQMPVIVNARFVLAFTRFRKRAMELLCAGHAARPLSLDDEGNMSPHVPPLLMPLPSLFAEFKGLPLYVAAPRAGGRARADGGGGAGVESSAAARSDHGTASASASKTARSAEDIVVRVGEALAAEGVAAIRAGLPIDQALSAFPGFRRMRFNHVNTCFTFMVKGKCGSSACKYAHVGVSTTGTFVFDNSHPGTQTRL